ncbi:MAG: hypothetical protein Q9218_007204 [Villophora microphyllina]
MNFRPESGYDTTVKVLRALGLPINDKNVSTTASQGSNTQRVSSSSSQALPRYQAISEETQMKNEYTQGNGASYRAGLPDLGFIPSFSKPYPGPASSYRSSMTAEPGGFFDALESPNRSPPLADSAGLLPSPYLSERALTSYGYPALPSSAPATADRPATAPLTLTQLMPPRRELPFPEEPDNITKKQRIGVKEPGVDGVNNGQKAAAKSKSRAKPKPKAKEARPSLPKAKATVETTSEQQSSNDRSLASEPAAVPLSSEPRTLRSSTTHVASSSPPQQPAVNLVLTDGSPAETNAQKKSPAAAAVNKPSTEKAPSILVQFSKDLENISPEDYMSRLDQWVRKYQDLPAPSPQPAPTFISSTEKDQLAAYAAQPEEERLRVLDGMICEYLEDENFMKLIGDVEMSWRRIGLGF